MPEASPVALSVRQLFAIRRDHPPVVSFPTQVDSLESREATGPLFFMTVMQAVG